MAPDVPSGSRPAPVVLRIKLRYDDVETMVQRFAPNVGKSGLFLPTKSLQPVGAELKFELRIADDTPVLVGLGRVKAARAPDPAAPRAAFGMAIELMRVTRESRDVILKMLERRRQLGLPELGIPMPADIDAARRSEVVDTQVKDTTSAPVPAPVPSADSGPSESLLTAPRRPSGPVAVAKVATVAALAPEPPRRKRPAIHEVIESASGPIASVVSVPGLDDDVDVAAVLARARSLAGGALDAELEALREVAAAPLEISIEAASAELARQLGGAAVARRDRSAGWAPPPKVETRPQAQLVSEPAIVLDLPPVPDEPVPAPEPEREPEPGLEAAPVTTAVDEAPLPPPAHPTLFDEEEESAPVHTAPGMIHDDADPRAFVVPEPAPRAEDDDEDEEVAPEQIADEIHTLGDGDLEEVEHTAIGAMPGAEAEPEPEPESDAEDGFAQHAYATEPAVAAELAASLDAQLAEAEAEAEQDDLGISGAYAMPAAPIGEPIEAPVASPEEVPEEDAEAIEEIDDFEILAEADAEDEDLMSAHGEAEAPGELAIPQEPAYAAPQYYAPVAEAPLHLDDDDPMGELEERPIHRVPVRAAPRHTTPEPRPSQSDFVSRLDLSDEFEAAPPSELDDDPRRGALDVSAGHALAQFDVPDEGPLGDPDDLDRDSNYTVAERQPPPELDFDAPHAAYPRAESIAGFDKSDVIPNRAPPRSARRPTSGKVPVATAPPGPAPGDDGYDLETALEALDVDLDDLAVPGTQPPGARVAPQPRVATRVPKRATTDDGVLIDFDDDE